MTMYRKDSMGALHMLPCATTKQSIVNNYRNYFEFQWVLYICCLVPQLNKAE